MGDDKSPLLIARLQTPASLGSSSQGLRGKGRHRCWGDRDGRASTIKPLTRVWVATLFFTQTPPSTISSHLLGHLRCLHISPIENLLVAIHPDLSQAHLVASNDADALGEGVRALGTEHVAYHRARDDLQLAPALPHLPQEDTR